METAAAKKITLATVKSFIRKNREALFVRTDSRFNGMIDCCQETNESGFSPAMPVELSPNTQGVRGVWFVHSNRNFFRSFSNADFTGYEVSNCCGRFAVVVRK